MLEILRGEAHVASRYRLAALVSVGSELAGRYVAGGAAPAPKAKQLAAASPKHMADGSAPRTKRLTAAATKYQTTGPADGSRSVSDDRRSCVPEHVSEGAVGVADGGHKTSLATNIVLRYRYPILLSSNLHRKHSPTYRPHCERSDDV
jgi:hypothetical protein